MGRLGTVALATLLTLGACESFELGTRQELFNSGFSNNDNKQLLLNAVRASHRYPMMFSTISKLTSTGEFDGTQFQLSIPFGPQNHNIYGFNPTVRFGEGMSIDTVPNDTQEFYEGFLQPVSLDQYDYYIAYDWDAELISATFIRKIILKEAFAREIRDAAVATRPGCVDAAQCLPTPNQQT